MGVKEFFSKVKEKIRGIAHYDTEGYKNKRKYVLAVASLGILVVLVVAFFAGGSMRSRSLTGLVVQQEGELTQLQIDLDSFSGEVAKMTQELATKEEELNSKEQEVSDLQTQVDERDESLITIRDEITSFSGKISGLESELSDLENENGDLVEAVEAYVRSECCSFNDALDGNDKSWDLDGEGIECSGQYTIDCGTGESDFLEGDSEEEED